MNKLNIRLFYFTLTKDNSPPVNNYRTAESRSASLKENARRNPTSRVSGPLMIDVAVHASTVLMINQVMQTDPVEFVEEKPPLSKKSKYDPTSHVNLKQSLSRSYHNSSRTY